MPSEVRRNKKPVCFIIIIRKRVFLPSLLLLLLLLIQTGILYLSFFLSFFFCRLTWIVWDSVAGGCSMVCFHFFFSFFFWGVSGVAGASDGLNLVGYPSFFFVFSDLIAAGGMWVWLLMDQPHVRRISFIFFFISTWPPHAVAFVSFFFHFHFPAFFFLLPLLGGRGRWTAYEIAVR